MVEKTEMNLGKAFAAESRSSIRNAVFALKAEKDKDINAAKLLRAVSDSESVHANRLLLLTRGKIGTTEENLKAFENEIRVNLETYRQMIKIAEEEEVSAAVMKALTQTKEVGERYARLYKGMIEGRNADYFVCQICGYIAEDEIPENCPVCGAVKTRFKAVM